MARDGAGSSLRSANNIGKLGFTSKARQDGLSASDTNDLYRFQVTQRSRVKLDLSGLSRSSNADIELFKLPQGSQSTLKSIGGIAFPRLTRKQLSQFFKLVGRSRKSGSQNETIAVTLAPGDYCIRVVRKQGKSAYSLRLAATNPSPTANSEQFDISFNYQYDTQGWFTPERRALLETAASFWESRIQNDFPVVASGTTVRVRHPETLQDVEVTLGQPIDDLEIFVGSAGASKLGANVAANSGFGVIPTSNALNNRLTAATYQPFVGTLTFNRDVTPSWFFDATPATTDDVPLGAPDFLATAAHEIGHVLGIGTAPFFNSVWDQGSAFSGVNATRANGGNAVPLDTVNRGHIAPTLLVNGLRTLMSTPGGSDRSRAPTNIDLAILADLGYTITGL